MKNTIETQDEANVKYLIGRLEKECVHKPTGYMGVATDDLRVDEHADTLVEHLFDRIMNELLALDIEPYDFIRERDEDFEYEYKPFTSERSLNLYMVRLGKFVHKYANKYLTEDKADKFIKEVGKYISW